MIINQEKEERREYRCQKRNISYRKEGRRTPLYFWDSLFQEIISISPTNKRSDTDIK